MKRIILLITFFIGIAISGYSQWYITELTVADTSAVIPRTLQKYSQIYVADRKLTYVSKAKLTSGLTVGHYVTNGDLELINSTTWTETGNYLYPRNITDSVGIGLTNPSSLFEVKDLFKDTNLNLFIGQVAGHSLTSGKYNTFLGDSVGYSNTTGNENVALGTASLRNNTSGVDNVAIGLASLYSNTSGGNNIAIGSGALHNTTNNDGNTAIGYMSSYYLTEGGNVSLGYKSLYEATKSARNTIIGYESGYSIVDVGGNNTFLGYQSGYSNNGTDNVFLGNRAGYNETGSNKLYIANSSTTTPLIYGEFDNDLLTINGHLSVTDSLNINGSAYADSIIDIDDLIYKKHTAETTVVNSSTYTVVSTDYFLAVTYTTTGAVTITIPTSECTDGRQLVIKDAGFNANANNITIQTGGSETIDGNSTKTISNDKDAISLQNVDGNWLIY